MAKQAVHEKNVEQDETKATSSWSLARLFWGLALMLVGVLLLLDALDVIEVHLWNLWQLWPLLIVATGISILAPRGSWWTALGALLIVGMLGIATWVALGAPQAGNADVTTATITREDAAVRRIDASVKGGATNMSITSSDTETAVTAELRSTITSLSHTSRVEGDTQYVSVEMKGRREWWRGNPRNELDVTLTRSMPISLAIDAGASSIDADLSEVQLHLLTIDAGASSLTLTLGSKLDQTEVSIDSGASSVTLRVPKESGVRFTLEGGLNSKSLDDLQQVADNVFESKNFSNATKKITITGELGLASITLQRY